MATLNQARLLDDDGGPSATGTAVPAAAATSRRAAARPGALLAVATAGLLAMTVLVAGERQAAAQGAQPDSRSVGVAQALGIDSSSPVGDRSLTREGGLLEQLAASRAERETEQAAAAQTQDQAEQAALAARAEAEARAAAEAARPTAVMPIDAARMTSSFGPRWGTLHAGVDLAAPMMTPEFAAMDGIVLQAGPASGFGLAVYIQHGNGDVTVYGHMEKILVSAGQVVRAGDTIALVGNRGQSTGPHLHFEVRIGGLRGEPVDPLAYLRQRGVQI